MTLKIESIEGRIRLSGEFRSEHLDQVKAEIDRQGSPVVLDLEELTSVDVDGIRFLNACEAKGISVSHCSPYIKAWMSAERERQAVRTQKGERTGNYENENKRTTHGAWGGRSVSEQSDGRRSRRKVPLLWTSSCIVW